MERLKTGAGNHKRSIALGAPSFSPYLDILRHQLLVALCAWGQRHAKELNQLDEVTECVIKPVNTKRAKVLRGLSVDQLR
jgi:hypothetical protein